MKIYALIGKSGTGKSHRSQYVSKDYGISCIIDDGLLIRGNKVIAGISAKKEATRMAAVKRAVFIDPIHRKNVKETLERLNPPSILILGTSDNMVDKIVANLGLPPVEKRIYIEDIATQREIELATRTRKEQGKHVIPVPTFEIKKDFSGYFIDSIKSFTRKDKDAGGDEDIEKTVVRPTFSYLGNYTIATNVIKNMVAYSAEGADGIYKVQRVGIKNTDRGIIIDIDITVYYGIKIPTIILSLREKIKREIEYITAFNILEINVYVKGISIEK